MASDLSLRFASISPETERRLGIFLDPGLEAGNPLDLWGTGSETAERFGGSLIALADDPETDAVALCIDLVYEYDGDDSYEKALIDAHRCTTKAGRSPVQPAQRHRPGGGRSAEARRHTGTRRDQVGNARPASHDREARLPRATARRVPRGRRSKKATLVDAARWRAP